MMTANEHEDRLRRIAIDVVFADDVAAIRWALDELTRLRAIIAGLNAELAEMDGKPGEGK